MNDLLPLKIAIVAMIASFIDVYYGAFAIAIMVTFVRAFYSNSLSLEFWIKNFVMALLLTILVVHIGSLLKWPKDAIIVVEAVCAFVPKELLDLVLYAVRFKGKNAINKFLGDTNNDK